MINDDAICNTLFITVITRFTAPVCNGSPSFPWLMHGYIHSVIMTNFVRVLTNLDNAHGQLRHFS